MHAIASSAVRAGAPALESLQILRGLAAFGVMLLHVPIFLDVKLGLGGLLPSMPAGAAGVDVFFVISGFIMVYASGALFGRRGAPLVFAARRLARIVPLYWAASGLLLGYMVLIGADLAAGDLSWGAIWASFFFIPYPRPSGHMLPLLNVGWTLNYEMFFYLVFAAALPLTRRRAVLAVVGFLLALVLARFVAPLPIWLGYLASPIVLEFCFGMVIALAYLEGVRLSRSTALILILASCAAFCASNQWGGFHDWRVLEWGVPAAMLVTGSLWLVRGTGAGIVRRFLVRLGDASYSLYLLHTMVLIATPRLILRFLDPASAPWLCVAVMLAAPIVVAFMVHALFERPVTRWLQRRIGGRAVPGPVSATGELAPQRTGL